MDVHHASQMSSSKANWWCEDGESPDKHDDMEKPLLKTVIAILAREMLKKAVPKQVYLDCADTINKAFKIGDERMENHKRNMQRINSRKLLSPNLTYHQMKANDSMRSLYEIGSTGNNFPKKYDTEPNF